MKKTQDKQADAAELRRRAEERLKERKKGQVGKGATPLPAEEPQRLIHELQVHQIELEMQNEELQKSRAEVEAGLALYADLYDFAPVGYFTFDRDGTIRRVNLTGARLLGLERETTGRTAIRAFRFRGRPSRLQRLSGEGVCEPEKGDLRGGAPQTGEKPAVTRTFR